MKLFETVQLGSLTLKNRLVMPPMAVGLANADGTVNDRCINYYGTRARGGVSMVIVEVASIDSNWRHLDGEQIGVDDDRFLPGLSRLAMAIQAGGAKATLQIGHPGPHGHNWEDPAALLLAAVATKPAPFYPPLRQLTAGEIAGMVEAWARCAKRTQSAGFDAVEIHGAHGYLLSSFLSPYYNRREDQYGGDIYGRSKFLM
ncbi:MAG: hypothetical protein Q7O66_17515, partial [Dehalococcoidia bacterium]|nr:hypothetical protein [Dehalococcoidia bacterium]